VLAAYLAYRRRAVSNAQSALAHQTSKLSRKLLVQRLFAIRFQIPERDRISLVHGVGLDQPEMPAEHEKHE
jgi:hypothetical protein